VLELLTKVVVDGGGRRDFDDDSRIGDRVLAFRVGLDLSADDRDVRVAGESGGE
jgi:hypothetical protein